MISVAESLLAVVLASTAAGTAAYLFVSANRDFSKLSEVMIRQQQRGENIRHLLESTEKSELLLESEKEFFRTAVEQIKEDERSRPAGFAKEEDRIKVAKKQEALAYRDFEKINKVLIEYSQWGVIELERRGVSTDRVKDIFSSLLTAVWLGQEEETEDQALEIFEKALSKLKNEIVTAALRGEKKHASSLLRYLRSLIIFSNLSIGGDEIRAEEGEPIGDRVASAATSILASAAHFSALYEGKKFAPGMDPVDITPGIEGELEALAEGSRAVELLRGESLAEGLIKAEDRATFNQLRGKLSERYRNVLKSLEGKSSVGGFDGESIREILEQMESADREICEVAEKVLLGNFEQG